MVMDLTFEQFHTNCHEATYQNVLAQSFVNIVLCLASCGSKWPNLLMQVWYVL